MRALVYDSAFRGRAGRQQAWGFGLITAAACIWLWVAAQLLLPFTVDYDECESRVFYTTKDVGMKYAYEDYADAEGTSCAAQRDLAGLLALLLLSMPTAVAGTFLYTSGRARRLSEHAAEMARLAESREGQSG